MYLFGVAALGLLTSPAPPQSAPKPQTTISVAAPYNPQIGQDTLLPKAYTHCDSAKYAMCVMDAKTGEVMISHNAHAPRYPASLVKMMTTLLALEKIERGEWYMNTQLIVPDLHFTTKGLAKVGLKAGQKISVKQALLYTHVVSAADAAETIAANIVDSTQSFVPKANQKAKILGMDNTVFINASGDRDNFYSATGVGVHAQVSTAYDMALLAKALAEKVNYQKFLATSAVYCAERRKTYQNHALKPALVAQGAVLAKTGTIDAAGNNIAVLFNDNKIGVVFGARSSWDRAKHVLEAKAAADDGQCFQQTIANLQQPHPWLRTPFDTTKNHQTPFVR